MNEASVPGSRMSRIPEETADSEARISAAARRVIQEVDESQVTDNSLEAWRTRAEQVVCRTLVL